MRTPKPNGLILCLLALVLTSGSPRINLQITKEYPPLDFKEEVKLFETNEDLSSKGEELGVIKLGDTGFTTDCNFVQMVEYAKIEARKVGGNAIKIIDHKKPDLISTCDRIAVMIYKLFDANAPIPNPLVTDSISEKKDYALLHIYRSGIVGFLVEYDLHLGDSVICHVQSDWRKTIRIKKDGLNTLWARTEAKEEIPIDIKMGNEYYIRCDVTMGAFVGHPSLKLVGKDVGKYEYKSVKFDGIELPDLLILNDGREIECKIQSQDNANIYFSIVKNNTEIKTQINRAEVKEIRLEE